MSVKATFDINAIFAELRDRKLPMMVQAIAEALQKACLDTVAEAKNVNTYLDQTNNLRSSIGYAIYCDGEKKSKNFEIAGRGTMGDGGTGAAKGEAFADQLALQFPTGIVGIIVAGMDYALYVEARGYDVVTGSSQHLVERLEGNLQSIREAINEINSQQ